MKYSHVIRSHRNTHVNKEKEVTEQVDGVNRNPAEKEYNSYAPQEFLSPRHTNCVLGEMF